MLWKYIEKINWEKEIPNIFLLKNKRLYTSIIYKGYFWECGLDLNRYKYSIQYGWSFSFTVFGLYFSVGLLDKRKYNENEGRFYLEDEPTSSDYREENYLERVKSFMQKHPELKEGYYERVLKEMQDTHSMLIQTEKVRRRQEREAQRNRKQVKEFLTKLPSSFDVNKVYKAVLPYMLELPWWRRLRKQFYVSTTSVHIGWYWEGTYRARYESEEVFLDSFSAPPFGWCYLPDIISDYDLYDKEGNLLSRASDYKTHTEYKRISNIRTKYLYDKNGNLLYKKRYRW